jgi:hypothetical protein
MKAVSTEVKRAWRRATWPRRCAAWRVEVVAAVDDEDDGGVDIVAISALQR